MFSFPSPPSLERSRKRHKSDDRATMAKRRALPALPSATTPLSSLSPSTALDLPDSDDEDNLNLPVIKLPGTPPVVAEAEMETGAGGATGISITPEAVTQRTKAKKITDTAVGGVASNKEGGASKRRSSRQSAGTGVQAGTNEKKKSSRKSSEDAKGKKGKTDDGYCGAAVKERKTVSKKTSNFKIPCNVKLCDLSALLFSFTQAVIFEPEGIKGHQEDPSHKEKAAITQTSSTD